MRKWQQNKCLNVPQEIKVKFKKINDLFTKVYVISLSNKMLSR